MPSLIPRKIRRYKKEYPYSYRGLFFFLELADSLFQLAIVGLLCFGGYAALKHLTTKEADSLASTSVPAALDTIESEVADNHNNKKPEVLTASTEAPASVSSAISTTELVVPAISDATATASITPQQTLSSAPIDGTEAISWVNQQRSSDYLIQFASSPDKSAMLEFALSNLSDGSVLYPYKRTPSNRPVYGLARGVYPSLETAQQAISEMPAALRNQQPWIRPLGQLKSQIATTIQQ